MSAFLTCLSLKSAFTPLRSSLEFHSLSTGLHKAVSRWVYSYISLTDSTRHLEYLPNSNTEKVKSQQGSQTGTASCCLRLIMYLICWLLTCSHKGFYLAWHISTNQWWTVKWTCSLLLLLKSLTCSNKDFEFQLEYVIGVNFKLLSLIKQ